MSAVSYETWLILTGALTLTLAGFIWRRRSSPGGHALFFLFLAVTLWNWMYAGVYLSNQGEEKRIWLNMAHFGILSIAPLLLVLILQYTGRAAWLTRRVLIALFIVPGLTLLIVWTDPLHHLYFGQYDFTTPAGQFRGGPWYWFNLLYVYGITLYGVGLLVVDFARAPSYYRKQLISILAGILVPAIGIGYFLLFDRTFPAIDYSPVFVFVSCISFAYGMLSLGLMDLTYISRDILVENIEDGLLVVDLLGRVVDLNTRALQLASVVDAPIGKPVIEVFARWKEMIEEHVRQQERFQLQLPDHPFLYLDISILPLKDRAGQMLGKIITWRDITAAKKNENDLRIFRYAMEQSPSAVLITDAEGRIEYVNAQFTHLTGYSLEDVRGQTPRVLKSGETNQQVYKYLWEAIKRGETWQGEILNRKKDGGFYWAQQMIAPVTDANGKAIRFIAMQQDITERKHTESELRVMNTRLQVQIMEIEHLHEQLREEAIRDSLTRLFNRRFMEETLEREISRSDRESFPISVVMMDVDHFKSINDTYGHQAGDTVLQTLGTLLLENTRISDIACRYGGDEMVVVMPGATLQDAARRAEEWRSAFSLLEFSIGDVRVRTTLSLGIACFPNHAKNPNELLGAADKALYQAKASRNCVETYEPAMKKPHPLSLKEH